MRHSFFGAVILGGLAVVLYGCRDQSPPEQGGLYVLTAVNGAGLPFENIVSATLTLGSDHQFTLVERDTAGASWPATGDWYPVGPIEVGRVFLEDRKSVV